MTDNKALKQAVRARMKATGETSYQRALQAMQDEQAAAAACGRCRLQFDPADTSPDGRARYQGAFGGRFCKGCVSRCHESTDFAHSCPVCQAAPGGQATMAAEGPGFIVAYDLGGGMSAAELVEDWLGKARLAARLSVDEAWPAWSVGELLAVALILDAPALLERLDFTREQALERLRYDIGQPTTDAAAQVFYEARGRLLAEQEEEANRHLEHCFHHTCSDDNDACAAGDCGDEDDCVHCECCCSCLACEYGPRDGMLMHA